MNKMEYKMDLISPQVHNPSIRYSLIWKKTRIAKSISQLNELIIRLRAYIYIFCKWS